MFSIKHLTVCVILCTHYVNPNEIIKQMANTTRVKRQVTTIYDKTFKKERVSSAAFTKDASTQLDQKTWPK